MSDAEELVPDEGDVGVKRVARGGRTVKAKKSKVRGVAAARHRQRVANALDDSTVGLTTQYPLKVPFPVTEATENINRFMVLHKSYNFRDRDNYTYTPMPPPRHIQELPVYDDRDFVVDTDALGLATVTHPDYDDEDGNVHEYYPGGTITYWTVLVYNQNNPDDVFELFKVPAHGKLKVLVKGAKKTKTKPAQAFVYGDPKYGAVGSVTTVVSNSRDEVVKLGTIACEILNRMPEDIDLEVRKGNEGINIPRMRSFVERTALMIWRPKFDFRLLPKTFYNRASPQSRTLENLYMTTATSSRESTT